MFDLGATELLLIVIVAVIVIGPKDMPLAMRHAGRWIAQMRKLSGHFRAGLDAMVREAELEEMEKKWAARNEEIMKDHPAQTGDASAQAEAKLEEPAAPESGAVKEPEMTLLAQSRLKEAARARDDAQTDTPATPDAPEKS